MIIRKKDYRALYNPFLEATKPQKRQENPQIYQEIDSAA